MMAGQVVAVPGQKHRCQPPEEDLTKVVTITVPAGVRQEGAKPLQYHPQHAPGTLWECECGRWWRAWRPYVNVMEIEWRRARFAKHWHAWRTVLSGR